MDAPSPPKITSVSMDSENPCKITFKIKREGEEEEEEEEEENRAGQESTAIPSFPSSSSSSSSSSDSDDEFIQSHFKTNQLVLYDPAIAKANANAAATVNRNMSTPRTPNSFRFDHENANITRTISYPFNHTPRVLPSVGAFTVQCASCMKWRLIPTKDKYEEIRENILEQPFFCDTAREWRPSISCDDPPDITQDGSRLWAIDKPNIAQPPPGWQRLLRIRGEGGTRFADVYYESPTGKKLRSTVEIHKYLLQHPEYLDAGVTMSDFSFQIPKPLQENYVRKRTEGYAKKRPAHLTASSDASRLLESGREARPITWVGVGSEDGTPDLQLCTPSCSPPHLNEPLFDPFIRPTKKRSNNRNSTKEYRRNLSSSP